MLKQGIKRVLLASIVTLSLVPAVSAQAAVTIIDNDSDTFGNYKTGSWSYLNSGKYGDARIHWGISNDEYHWTLKNPDSTGWYKFEAYVNNGSFSTREASYYKDGSYVGGLNQHTAYGGWNKITDVWMVNGWNYDYSVSAFNRGDNLNTGADAIGLTK
ncbi:MULTISPECIES: hypothetical protein [Bacillus]|uniref:hypothetical protein n=1 Tax=Bacillus TaxID=1386 RepID=UPI00036B5C95|nr:MULTISPECIES: hypothetical protein [Bacillus]PED69774.1 hypothetical protein CON97_23220 [Bacillus pseudomycoides]PEO41730.1 hypothetical protein CN559_26800 [Bacillus pseudomycoides]PEP60168.1 hypothetical protein CN564_09925 [Bacillus pseudomycoides]PFW91212.1 hypothetical protein COL29_19250 [Bacillus pseudomycoides]PFX36649.1 hypothetical protein COL32_28140 [Bacillus pseudomycoides]